MVRAFQAGLCLGTLLSLALAATAQDLPAIPAGIASSASPAGSGLEPESLPAEHAEDIAGATDSFRIGVTPVS